MQQFLKPTNIINASSHLVYEIAFYFNILYHKD